MKQLLTYHQLANLMFEHANAAAVYSRSNSVHLSVCPSICHTLVL